MTIGCLQRHMKSVGVVWRCLLSVSLIIGAAGPTLAAGADSLDVGSGRDAAIPAALVQRVLQHGPWPPALRPDPDNAYSGDPQAIRLGRQLFAEPGLSGNGKVSCATCHIPAFGFAEPRARAQGLGRHPRNTQGLLNADLQRWLGRDGGADSLWAATLRPLLSPVEMGASIEHIASTVRRIAARLHADALIARLAPVASDEQVAVAGAKAIAAWVQTLRSPRTRFDRLRDYLATRPSRHPSRAVNRPSFYPAAAWRGLALFAGDARCHVCHYGPNFSNGEFHDVGRPFLVAPGQVDPGRYAGIQRVRNDRYNRAGPFAPAQTGKTAGQPGQSHNPLVGQLRLSQLHWGQWRTPSLRNLVQTAPYMHDGSLATLRAVVDWYADIDTNRLHANGETILQPLALSNAQRNDIVAFLRTLSTEPGSVPGR